MTLKSLIKITITFVFFICFSSDLIAQKKQRTKTKLIIKNNANAHSNLQTVSEQTKRVIRASLFKDYYQKYKAELSYYEAYKVVVDSSNGFIQLRYVNANNEPSFAPLTEIPAYKDFIQGDLNKDSCNDLIVSVYHSQNGRPRLDIYCYITKNKQLQFYKMYTGRELGICENVSDTSGRFFPSKIVNGEFIGGTDCYKSGDPGCCPSLEMVTYFKFEDGLKFLRQEPKNKTK